MYFKVRISIALCMLLSNIAIAQVQTPRNISMTELSKGYYEYLPQGYNSSNETYPLLIFIHGLGELGNGASQLPYVLRHGPPKMISQGTFPVSFTVNGQTFKYIVISPQFTDWPGNGQLNNIIDYVIAHYRVDINRIYLTGLSMGGGVVWDYTGGWNYYASRIAAIVPICGASWPNTSVAYTIAAADVAVWATHNNGDPTAPLFYTVDYVNYINTAPNPPTPLAKKTIFVSNSHDAWTATYNLNFRENGMNIFEWMLQFKRNFTVLPVTGLQFDATKTTLNTVALSWTTLTETNIRGFAVQRSTDGDHFTTIGFVNSTSANGAGASYNFIDPAPTGANNFYRLEEQPLSGGLHYSDTRLVSFSNGIAISIYPNPAREILHVRTTYYFINAQADIYNAKGQLVLRQKLNGSGSLPLQVAALSPGVYIVSINDGIVSEKFRFLKQ